MDSGDIAKKVDALEAELAAKSSRIADLEARVSFLEAENARLRKVSREGEAMDHICEIGPTIGRLKEGFGGNKEKPIDMSGERAVDDVIELSDGEEDGMAVDVNKGESAEEGAPAVPTPVKCAMRVSTGQSDDGVEIMNTEGGGGGNNGSVCCDAHEDLEDDDVSITSRGKNRAAARVISDSESDDGDEEYGGHENEKVSATGNRKRVLRDVSDSESEDFRQGVESEDDDGELYEMEGRSTPATRRSARLAKIRSKRIRPTRRALEFVEPKDHQESEDDSEEDDSMDEFIDDSDCEENSAESAEEYSAELEESDNEETYKDAMARIRGKKNAKNEEWEYEADMLSAFAEQPELRLKAVCALYRKQTEEEKTQRSTIVHNKQGFSQIDAPRGSRIAQFLLDGDAFGPLKKTAQDLKNYERSGPKFCHRMAQRYSKQLFRIYKEKEDPYFP